MCNHGCLMSLIQLCFLGFFPSANHWMWTLFHVRMWEIMLVIFLTLLNLPWLWSFYDFGRILLRIGNQALPKEFDLTISIPSTLCPVVHEPWSPVFEHCFYFASEQHTKKWRECLTHAMLMRFNSNQDQEVLATFECKDQLKHGFPENIFPF